MRAINRRAVLTAAPALLLPTAMLATQTPAAPASVEDQMQQHVAALMDFVRASAPAEFPRIGDLHIMNDWSGRRTLCGTAFPEGEFRAGDRYARLRDGPWEVVT